MANFKVASLEDAGFTQVEFNKFVNCMKEKLLVNAHKGISWKTYPTKYLQGQLLGELGEYLIGNNSKELADIACVCLMLYIRELEGGNG